MPIAQTAPGGFSFDVMHTDSKDLLSLSLFVPCFMTQYTAFTGQLNQ